MKFLLAMQRPARLADIDRVERRRLGSIVGGQTYR
jgi:hypothetical protein